jgi:hypothetical protein
VETDNEAITVGDSDFCAIASGTVKQQAIAAVRIECQRLAMLCLLQLLTTNSFFSHHTIRLFNKPKARRFSRNTTTWVSTASRMIPLAVRAPQAP